jgi:hypothetical protein
MAGITLISCGGLVEAGKGKARGEIRDFARRLGEGPWTTAAVVRSLMLRSAGDLAGSVKGLPQDLADDPRYMDGFGE